MNFFKCTLVFFLTSLLYFSNTPKAVAQCAAKFSATVESGKQNEEVTVKIRVSNFTDIGGIQWTIRWDPTVIQYSSIGDFNLPDLSTGSFNVTKVSQGYFTTSWYNQNGVTRANGDSIFTIKFKLIGADGKASNIDFSGTPLAIEISDKNAQKCTNATLTSGKVNIGTVTNPPPTGVSLKIANVDNASSSEFCIPFSVTGFKSITAMQFSLNWDATKLTFSKVQNFSGLTQFDQNNFNPTNGKLSCLWFDQATTGQTVADNKTIFEVCFKYTGACPGTATINITDDPVKVLVQSTTGQLTPDKISSTVTCTGGTTQPLAVSIAKTTSPCPGQSNGAIDLTVTGGSGNPTYSWSDGNTSKNRTNLAAGNYTVTVKDGSSTQTATATLTALSVTATPVNPTNGNNGSITLSVTGGNGTSTYKWSNNATTKDINNLGAGEYTYTVTDANGCTASAKVTLADPSIALDITNITPVGPACSTTKDNGTINITVIGGKTPYKFAWTGPNGYTSSNEDISGLKAGTYKVTITDAANATKTSSDIILADGPALVINGTVKNETRLGNDGSITLTPTGGTPPISYRWNDGSVSSSRTLLSAGTYTVTGTDSKGCSATKSFTVANDSKGECYTSSRAFSPNGDGINEYLIISCLPAQNQLLVFNRWNQMVFTANNYQNTWTGIDNQGVAVPDGTYYWVLKDKSNTENKLYKGYTTIIRTLN